MDNQVWKELIGRLYNGFRNTTEVLAVIGYIKDLDNEGVDVVEYIEYYTSHDESEVLGNFRSIVKEMSKYVLLRGKEARFVVVHNHPGGTMRASASDVKMTQKFNIACRVLGATMMGSYIFVNNDTIALIGSKEDEFNTVQIRMRNQYPLGDRVSMTRTMLRTTYRAVEEDVESIEVYGQRLNESVLDRVFNTGDVEPFGVVELDDSNNILGVYELNKLQPIRGDRDSEEEQKYRFGMATLMRRDNPRYVVYDKRTGVARDELGLADDAKKFIQAMGLVGYPINFYIND